MEIRKQKKELRDQEKKKGRKTVFCGIRRREKKKEDGCKNKWHGVWGKRDGLDRGGCEGSMLIRKTLEKEGGGLNYKGQ